LFVGLYRKQLFKLWGWSAEWGCKVEVWTCEFWGVEVGVHKFGHVYWRDMTLLTFMTTMHMWQLHGAYVVIMWQWHYYEKLSPLKPHCFTTRARKTFIYNYCVTIPWVIQLLSLLEILLFVTSHYATDM